jgi:hypothetical protein
MIGIWKTSTKRLLGLAAACSLLLGVGCTSEPEPLLAAGRLIGSTPEDLVSRLGQPEEERGEVQGQYGFMRWLDIQGVRVLVVIQEGKGSYVSYRFPGTELLDEAAALETIGVELPDTPPESLGDANAKRWQPCGAYGRLTINADTRLVSIGSYPL